MPLFHPKVLKKLNEGLIKPSEEHTEILSSWAQSITDGTIYKRKETELQGLFRDKIVTQVLGYKPFSGANTYDVFPEYPIAGKFVDLGLGAFDPHDDKKSVCQGVFELKGAKTKLDSVMAGRNKTPVQQAWEYAMDVKGARWVLVSNYIEIRLYAFGHGRQDYERFQLETLLEPEQYTRFIKILSKENLLGTYTQSLLEQSAEQDKDITDRLYQDYKIIRHNLISNIKTHNTKIEQADAVSYAQTILDRILFIAFAEDKELLPKNTLKDAYEHKDNYNPRPIWDTFKALFRSINEGNPNLKIPKYNGGLFSDNEHINKLVLPDTIFQGFKKLGDYDFATEVSVNILGHIFEQSITDIENLQKGLDDLSIKTKDGKRKKEGVVYTPAFVTRYIVDETLGGYLNRKRDELLSNHPEWILKTGDRVGEFKTEKSEIEFWRAWQNILQSVKVVDPACGSGAFLVAAFDYLYDEYTRANDRLSELLGNTGLFDPDREILTNNLYGVDLNSESIEITKLSLWLKTAKRGKVLNSLDANFRWGDSLIEDANYSVKAFTWKDGFPEIFSGGGFDVVLGNPPYVRQEFISHLKPYLEKRFEIYGGTIDLFAYFFELGLRVLKDGGRMGYICSSTFFKTGGGQSLRRYLKHNATQDVMIDFGDLQIFEGVTTYPTILVMTKDKPKDDSQIQFTQIKEMPDDLSQIMRTGSQRLNQSQLNDESWQFENNDLNALRTKIITGKKTLKEVYGSPYRGILTGYNEAFVIDGKTRDKIIKDDPKSAELIKPFLEGEDLKKWHAQPKDLYLVLIPRGYTKEKSNAQQDEITAWNWLQLNYAGVANYLKPFAEKAKKRSDKGDFWWELRACSYYNEFEKPKIVFVDISQYAKFSIDRNENYLANTAYLIPSDDPFLLGILMSKIIWFYWLGESTMIRGGFLRLIRQNVDPTPIPEATEKQKEIIGNLALECQKCAEERFEIQSMVRNRMATDLAKSDWDGKFGKALTAWWELEFKDIQPLIKKIFKRDIPIFERDDWQKYFDTNRAKVKDLSARITSLEAEINNHVYTLFNLTSEEIRLIEEGE